MGSHTVAKFGGTSLKTASAIRGVSEIITRHDSLRAVVVSAVGGVTNLLVEFCKADSLKRDLIKEQILETHLNLIGELQLSLEDEVQSLILKKLSQSQVKDAQSIDDILSLGEDLSSLIISSYLKRQLSGVLHVDARQFMITDDNYGKATPQLDKIKAYDFPKTLFVTQGFLGATKEGHATTLGRGGSDYSAALIAEALHADELLIYTDVPGVYTSDPNFVSGAHLIPELYFPEMAEMANFGAKILHPATLEPCVRSKVPVRILSTFEPEKSGTLVRVEETHGERSSHITAITMRHHQFLVTIKSLKMLNAYGFLANIFNILAQHKISVDLITTSEVSVALTIDGADVGSHNINPFIEGKDLLSKLQQFAEIIVEGNLTLIAIVGRGLNVPGVIQKILKLMEPYKVRLVCYGASHSSVGILVPKESANEVSNVLHRELLGEAPV